MIMGIQGVMLSYGLYTAFVFLLLHSTRPSSLLQGKRLPYMTSDVREVSGKSFDYIVVGGGTAGCPLAATLSQRFTVLIVERGGSPFGNPLVEDKNYFGISLIDTDEFSSVAQRFVSEDGVLNYRGRVLGGSSAINSGFYSRTSDDFVRKVGWDGQMVKQAYEWVESRMVYKPLLTKWQSAVEFGLLEAGNLPFNRFSFEHVEGTKIGGTIFDPYGVRHTSADLLAAGNPEHITVLLNATVKNIILHSNVKGNKTIAGGIRFIKSDGSTDRTYEAYLKKPAESSSWGDVILSAGTLGSPQILLQSGIGPRTYLRNLNINPVIDLEGVGQEMQDNPGIALLVDRNPEHRLPDTIQVAGITKGFEFIIEGAILPTSFNASRVRVITKLAFPESKGRLALNNTDPRQNPIVEFNYLDKEKDMDGCVRMVQFLYKVAKSRSVTLFLGAEAQINSTSNPDELRGFCRRNVGTYYHYHGGCNVGSVVDKDFKVYGVKGLRVVDFSTFLESPGTNPMATLLMVGRYQGIRILRERKHLNTFIRQQQATREWNW